MISHHLERWRGLIHDPDTTGADYLRACLDAADDDCLGSVLAYYDGQPRLSQWVDGWRVVVEDLQERDGWHLAVRAQTILEGIKKLNTGEVKIESMGDFALVRLELSTLAPGLRGIRRGPRPRFEALGQWNLILYSDGWKFRSPPYQLRPDQMTDAGRELHARGVVVPDYHHARLVMEPSDDVLGYLIEWLESGDQVAQRARKKAREARALAALTTKRQDRAASLYDLLVVAQREGRELADVTQEVATRSCALGLPTGIGGLRISESGNGWFVEAWRGPVSSLWWSFRSEWCVGDGVMEPPPIRTHLHLLPLWRTP